jgi:hypothetical protein
MPVTFDWNEQHILHVQYHDTVDGDDAVTTSLQMNADARFDNLRGIIINTLAITKNLANDEHVKQLVDIAKLISQSNPRIRNAIVAKQSDHISHAQAKLYKALAADLIWEVALFSSLSKAKAWVMQ